MYSVLIQYIVKKLPVKLIGTFVNTATDGFSLITVALDVENSIGFIRTFYI